MEFTGQVREVTKDWKTKEWRLLLSVNETEALEALSELQGDLTVEVKKYHKRRSLDSNAYLWVLCSKIGHVIGTSKDEVYEAMLQRYGVIEMNEGRPLTVTVASNVNMRVVDGHWKYYKGSPDGKWKSYMMLKGTSQYDSAEMTALLEMIIGEAKELGIETLPPDEIARMNAAWNSKAS